jgi:hypothetical protein
MILRLKAEDALAGLERLARRLLTIASIADYAGPLMEHWERLIEEDNRRGVLAGQDKDGNPAPPLTYRPKGDRKRYIGINTKAAAKYRLNQAPRLRRGVYAGLDAPGTNSAVGPNNNPSSAAYRRMTGPRLAPRFQYSRVITNLVTASGRDGNTWFAEGAWLNVVNREGEPFLQYHFNGEGQKLYDLRGVRPAGVAKMKEALREWARLEIRARYRGAA